MRFRVWHKIQLPECSRFFSYVVVDAFSFSLQLNWEMNFGKFHYWIKQFLTAFAIRALIEFFPTAGPAMNPMLATAWATFGVHNNNGFPTDNRHYFVYWIAPFIAALLASVTYAIYAGERIFGNSLPIGPFKSRGGAPAKAGKQKKKN
jgi:hypothetical protein